MQQIAAGNLRILNPFVFNQFSPYSTPFAVSCRGSSPSSLSPTNLLQPSMQQNLNQMLMHQASLLSGSGTGGYLQTHHHSGMGAGSPSSGAANDFASSWNRNNDSNNKLMCHSSMAQSNSPVSTSVSHATNSSSSPTPDHLCNSQSDLFPAACLSGLIQCEYQRYINSTLLSANIGAFVISSIWKW